MKGQATDPGSAVEKGAINEVVEHYIEGVREGDVDRLKKAFSPDAIMSGYLGEELMVLPIEDFYGLVRETPPPSETGEAFRAEVKELRQVGRTATVELAEYSLMGYDFADQFHLLKVDGGWKIISKLFQTVGGGD